MPKRPKGTPKLKWSEEEELALKAGVEKCARCRRCCSSFSQLGDTV